MIEVTDMEKGSATSPTGVSYLREHFSMGGLNKREILAAMALQGLLANSGLAEDPALGDGCTLKGAIVEAAVDFADLLLAELAE